MLSPADESSLPPILLHSDVSYSPPYSSDVTSCSARITVYRKLIIKFDILALDSPDFRKEQVLPKQGSQVTKRYNLLQFFFTLRFFYFYIL